MHPASESWSNTYATLQKLFRWFLANLHGWWHFPTVCHRCQAIFEKYHHAPHWSPCSRAQSAGRCSSPAPEDPIPLAGAFMKSRDLQSANFPCHVESAFSHSSCQLAFCTLVQRPGFFLFPELWKLLDFSIGKGHWMQTSLPIKSGSHCPQDKHFLELTVSTFNPICPWIGLHLCFNLWPNSRCESKVVQTPHHHPIFFGPTADQKKHGTSKDKIVVTHMPARVHKFLDSTKCFKSDSGLQHVMDSQLFAPRPGGTNTNRLSRWAKYHRFPKHVKNRPGFTRICDVSAPKNGEIDHLLKKKNFWSWIACHFCHTIRPSYSTMTN